MTPKLDIAYKVKSSVILVVFTMNAITLMSVSGRARLRMFCRDSKV